MKTIGVLVIVILIIMMGCSDKTGKAMTFQDEIDCLCDTSDKETIEKAKKACEKMDPSPKEQEESSVKFVQDENKIIKPCSPKSNTCDKQSCVIGYKCILSIWGTVVAEPYVEVPGKCIDK